MWRKQFQGLRVHETSTFHGRSRLLKRSEDRGRVITLSPAKSASHRHMDYSQQPTQVNPHPTKIQPHSDDSQHPSPMSPAQRGLRCQRGGGRWPIGTALKGRRWHGRRGGSLSLSLSLFCFPKGRGMDCVFFVGVISSLFGWCVN